MTEILAGRKEGMYHEDGRVVFWEGYLLPDGTWRHVVSLARDIVEVRHLLAVVDHVESAGSALEEKDIPPR